MRSSTEYENVADKSYGINGFDYRYTRVTITVLLASRFKPSHSDMAFTHNHATHPILKTVALWPIGVMKY